MAKNVIKGLTVEIGGDTTKLGKALEGVNKKSRDLSGELGQINKLLKLDPGNTELIAQKQKVLAEAVENTAEKLKTLKEAEKQVQKQFERGEVSEEQVRALQREIVETEKKLDGYKKAAKDTAKGLDQMDDSTEKVEKSSSEMGGTLKRVTSGGLKALAGMVAAAGAALIGAAEASREYRREMGKLDTAFTTAGHSSEAATETYKALQGVLGETDQAVEAANHLAKLTDNEKDLEKWTDICTGVYATFGASLPIEGLTEAANETAKVGKVTGPLADALNWAGVNEDKFNESLAACSTEQERQTLIMETLGGLYDDAAEKYKETNAEVIRANQANEEWASVMAEVGGAVEPLLSDIKLLGASLVEDLVPGIKEVVGAFRAMLNGDEGAAANLGEALSGIFSNILNKITEVLPAVAEMGTSLITTLVTSVVQAIPNLVSTFVQVALSIVQGIATAIPQIITALTSMIPTLVQTIVTAIPQIVNTVLTALQTAIPQLLQGAVQFFMAIIQAIPVICQELVPQIVPIITTICDTLIANIPLLLDGALQLLDAIIQAIPLICEALLPEIPKIVTTITDKLVEMFPMLLDGAITLFMALIEAIPVILDALLPEIPRIVQSVVQALVKMIPTLLAGAVKLFMALVQAIPKIVGELLVRLPDILTAIVSVLGAIPELIWGIVKNLPKMFVDLGKELVKGLWKGLSNSFDWIKKMIKSWVGNVLKFIKKLFGINSPSKETAYMGEMLSEGLAKGVEEKSDEPVKAAGAMSNAVLDEMGKMNGVTLERQINHTFTPPASANTAQSTVAGKLDQILKAIERGQILTINGDTLVGATAGAMNTALGQRRVLAERGAI